MYTYAHTYPAAPPCGHVFFFFFLGRHQVAKAMMSGHYTVYSTGVLQSTIHSTLIKTEAVSPSGCVEPEAGVDFEITTSWYVPESGGLGCLLLRYVA